MTGILKWLNPSVSIVPTLEELVDLASTTVSDHYAAFVSAKKRWSARGENPPQGYGGTESEFIRAGEAFAYGILRKADPLPDIAKCASAYLRRCNLTGGNANDQFTRLPMLPCSSSAALSAFSSIGANSSLKQAQRFVREYRKTHKRLVVAAEVGHAAPNADAVKQRAGQIAAVMASTVDSQPLADSSGDEAGVKDSLRNPTSFFICYVCCRRWWWWRGRGRG